MRMSCLLATFVGAILFAAGVAQAEEAVAIVADNTLLIFDTENLGTTTARPVIGLGSFEIIRGIDYRASTGELLACTVVTSSVANSVIKTYRIDHTTGAAILVGTTAVALAGAADVPTGFDRNPVVTVDRMRYVNTNDENARLNPNNGALAGNDTDLTPAATSTIIAAAYDRNTPDSTVSTLYVIDRNDSMLAIQGGINATPSPNGGVVTDLCPLGITLHPASDGGFDVSSSGIAYAALTDNATGLTGLYTLALPTAVTATPCATPVGNIGTGTIPVFSLTILPPDTDGDGVRDPLDGCPSDAAKTVPGVCGCGLADADTDADGTADCNDGCPNDPAKILPGSCGCGVADADTDADGIPDCNDGCPNDAAKVLPGACGCGVADTDTDADGISDCNDGCASDPAKTQPGACGCDVADTDEDGNGTPDCLDPPLVQTTGCGACGPSASGVILTALGLFAVSCARHRRKR